MTKVPSLDELCQHAPLPLGCFDPSAITDLPEPVQRWLNHSIEPGTPLSRAVRLRMHGKIRIDGNWLSFHAEEVLRQDLGFMWTAKMRMKGLPVSGYDLLLNGEGTMSWKILWFIPLMTSSGSDVSRSGIGRMHMESILLPSLLVGPAAKWSVSESGGPVVTMSDHGQSTEIYLTLDDNGGLQSFVGGRWGGPTGDSGCLVPFGGEVLAERTFYGQTLASEVRLGWYFGTDRFEEEGIFFHGIIDDAEFR